MVGKIHASIYGVDVGDITRPKLVGVLNLSRESFYQASAVDAENVAEVAAEMRKNRAEFLDLGARSTAPNAPPISIELEEERIVDALQVLLPTLEDPRPVLSIDTQYARVFERALTIGEEHGFDRFVLNDVSGLQTDREALLALLATKPVPVVLMPAIERPGDVFYPKDAIVNLREKIVTLWDLGVKTTIVDPGIGRWVPMKKAVDDLVLLDDLESFRELARPILVGISRKSFIGTICNVPDPAWRLPGTLAATAIAVYNGAHLVRTHDITKATLDAVTLGHAMRKVKLERLQADGTHN
ncbi:MAG: hypothetical protein Kow0069_25380 [Promethearchaeota archaeon]